MKKKNTKVFAQGICFYKLFWIFVIGCVFGAYYEEILNCVKVFLKTGTFIWELRRGVVYGPFSPIYGAGAVLLTALLARKSRPWSKTFLYGALLGGGFEYLISFLQETFIGTISWDYSEQFLNINGRTTIPIMIFWGILTLVFIQWIYPWLSKWIEKIPYHIGVTVTIICAILLSFDMLISWSALIRQNLRRNNVPAYTVVGEFFDRHYPDEFLEKFYPNMVAK